MNFVTSNDQGFMPSDCKDISIRKLDCEASIASTYYLNLETIKPLSNRGCGSISIQPDYNLYPLKPNFRPSFSQVNHSRRHVYQYNEDDFRFQF